MVDWADAEGWNPGLDDARLFAGTDPDGFYGGFLENRLVATISAVTYSANADQFGFIGFYIVAPHARGRGYGYQLWQHGMQHLAEVPVVGLDGVVDQQPNYRKSGFALAHRNIRYTGVLPGSTSDAVVDARTIPLTALAAFDARHFPVPRPHFVELWLHQPKAYSAVVCVRSDVIASGTIRQCRRGWKVGPLFAPTSDIAEEVLLSLAYRAGPRAEIYLDVPETNRAAVQLAESHGMTPMFETARMYRGPEPHLPIDQIFGITTFELG